MMSTLLQNYRRFRVLRRLIATRDAFSLAFIGSNTTSKESSFTLRADNELLHFREGTSDLSCFEKIFIANEYCSPFPIQPKTIVDAGANIGISTRFFAHQFPEAEIWAIEPDASNFKLLEKNCAFSPKIHPHHAALWPRDEPVFISDPSAEKWALEVTTQRSDEGQQINTISIQSLLAAIPTGRINLLKLDIEGAEKELFEDKDRAWLSKVDTIVIELHDRFKPHCARAFYSAICDQDFHQEILGENVFIYSGVKRR